MTYGNIVAIAQRNIKRLLAYSGIAQIGNMLIGMAAGTKMGSRRHAVLSPDVSVREPGRLCRRDCRQPSHQQRRNRGLQRPEPPLAVSWPLPCSIFLLSLAGVPPLAGFIGKLYIFVAAIKEGLYTLIMVGLVNIVISMYYYMIVVKKMYINEPTDPTPLAVSGPMKAVIYVGLAGTLILGM